MTAFEGRATVRIERPAREPHTFEGRRREDASVEFYGMFRGWGSIENVCTQFARQLVATIPGVALHGYTGPGFTDRELEAHAGIDARAPVAVFWGVPDHVPELLFEHRTTVGGFVCETDRIPARWARVCNRFDLVVAPSRFCQRAFRDSGVSVPILVVPHGVEPEYRPRTEKRREPNYRFYHTSMGKAAARKGVAELIRCFRRAFPDRPEVQLVLRIDRNVRVLRALTEAGVGLADPQIRLQPPSPLTTDEFAALYSEMHCTVHPAKGEGFGLIPMQSIACETPVIAPRATGLAEYLDESHAMVLRTHGRDPEPEVYYGCGSYPLLDEDHLVELLRHAESNWEGEYERLRRVAPAFRESHGWPRALSEVLSLLARLVDAESADRCREILGELRR